MLHCSLTQTIITFLNQMQWLPIMIFRMVIANFALIKVLWIWARWRESCRQTPIHVTENCASVADIMNKNMKFPFTDHVFLSLGSPCIEPADYADALFFVCSVHGPQLKPDTVYLLVLCFRAWGLFGFYSCYNEREISDEVLNLPEKKNHRVLFWWFFCIPNLADVSLWKVANSGVIHSIEGNKFY